MASLDILVLTLNSLHNNTLHDPHYPSKLGFGEIPPVNPAALAKLNSMFKLD
jgi:hypothetical protein